MKDYTTLELQWCIFSQHSSFTSHIASAIADRFLGQFHLSVRIEPFALQVKVRLFSHPHISPQQSDDITTPERHSSTWIYNVDSVST
jgi:hypothetical protein